MTSEIEEINNQIAAMHPYIDGIEAEIGWVIVGQRYLVERLLIGLLANGHVLLEGVPGLAKTATINALAQTIHTKFARIQFTPDLLPSDLVGNLIYNPREGTYSTKKGPIFANLILADEINRAPAKVQSALLEAMQERQVTIGDETHRLPDPFLVLATQNPIEQEGTYQLPEAQVDRFMMKLTVDYPAKAEEREILDRMARTDGAVSVPNVVPLADLVEARRVVDEIYMDDKIKAYIVDLIIATRKPEEYKLDLRQLIEYGASPRATIWLALASKAH